jgi:hypothetical protein
VSDGDRTICGDEGVDELSAANRNKGLRANC